MITDRRRADRCEVSSASIKHLEGWDTRAWKLRQYNPPRGEKAELNWPKREWPKALRVVGKYYGG